MVFGVGVHGDGLRVQGRAGDRPWRCVPSPSATRRTGATPVRQQVSAGAAWRCAP